MPIKDIKIEGKIIGKDSPIFLIAEAGVNHNGDITIAKKLIDLAAEVGVDAVKFQTFISENLILKKIPKVKYQKSSTNDQEDFYDMVKKYELTKEEFTSLKKYCEKKKIIFLSTPFDLTSVNWLEELGVAAYKVGSGDMNNFPLLKTICSKRKAIFLSTGMANLDEIKNSIDFIRMNGVNDIILFQCTTNYPASFEELNLNVIETFKKIFPDLLLGFSDHSLGIEASIIALGKGVKVIEKHFTLDREMAGPDHKASLNPNDLLAWVKAIKNAEKSLGKYTKEVSDAENEIAKVARKSIVSYVDLKEGDFLTENNIAVKRPGTGIPPSEFYNILGKKVKKNLIPKDTVIHPEDIE